MNKHIYILSNPIKSGKTTALMSWCNKKQNIGGILCPDVANLRMLYNISSKEYFPFQKTTKILSNDVIVGKFAFSYDGFCKAQEIINQALTQNLDWLIIDEIGKLELNNKGLEPALSNWITTIKAKKQPTILVVRDFLLSETMIKYGLQNAIIINTEKLNEIN